MVLKLIVSHEDLIEELLGMEIEDEMDKRKRKTFSTANSISTTEKSQRIYIGANSYVE